MYSSSSSHSTTDRMRQAAVFALAVAHLVSAASVDLLRRDTTVSSPATIPIQLSFDAYGRYLIGVGMSQGTGEQNFNFTLSTSTGMTSVAGQSCSTCSSTNLYDQSKSTTAQSLDGTAGSALVGQTIEGTVIKELCRMQTSNGSSWQYSNQTILIANSQGSGNIFNDNMSGLVGLGTNRNAGSNTIPGTNWTPSFNDTIYGQWMNRNPMQDTFQYGMSLEPPMALPKNSSGSLQAASYLPKPNAGRLDWLQPDLNAYDQNNVVMMPVSSNSNANYSTGSQPDFTVELGGWTLKSDGSEVNNNQILVTTVDPYYTDIYFPFAQAQLLNNIIEGSSYEPTLSSLGNQSGSWVVPCDSKYTFSVSISSVTFTLDQDVLMTNNNGICTSGVEGWTDDSISQYILGARFISQFYVIYQINRNGTDTIILSPRSSASHSSEVGAIVGGTVGGVAGLLLLALGGFFFWRRHHRRGIHSNGEKPSLDDHIAAHVEPFTMGASSQPPLSPNSMYAGQSVFGAQQSAYSAFSSPPNSPGAPLLQHDMLHDVLPPPAYAETEVGSSEGPTSPSTRTTKGEYVLPVRRENDEGASGSGRSPVSPLPSSFTGVQS